MTINHSNFSDRSTYPTNQYHALLTLILEAGGTGLTLDELVATEWFGTRMETKTLVDTFTAYDILDTIETGVPGEERILIIPGEHLITATKSDLQFAINVLFD